MSLITIDDARVGMIIGRDVLFRGKDGDVVILVRRGSVLTDRSISKLREHGIAYINADEQPDTISVEPVKNRIVVPKPSFALPETAPVVNDRLRDTAVDTLKEMCDAFDIRSRDIHEASRIIKRLDYVVEQLVQSLTGSGNTLVNINNLKVYDEYTYHHSLSVTVVTIAIAQACGITGGALSRIAKAAMMHDVGKVAMPIELIQKPARLNEDEFSVIRQHPKAGYDNLMRARIDDMGIAAAVLHHHEKYDGTGYPLGLKGEGIPLWSRIISVADVYDALTSNRPYRRPMQPLEAMEYIMGGVGSAFDFNVVDAFVKRMEPYPVGSMVELSDGRIAVVVKTEFPTRPVIRLIDDGKLMDLFNDKNTFGLVISRLLTEA